MRRDAGVVERGGLENRCARERTEGSKRSSAIFPLQITTNTAKALFVGLAYRCANWDWTIFVTKSEPEILAQVDSIRLVAIAVSLGSMIAVALMLALVTQQLLLLPIIKLQRAADAISRHENLFTTDIDCSDELGAAARNMERMSGSIFEYTAAAEAANRAKSNFLATMSHEIRASLGWRSYSPRQSLMMINVKTSIPSYRQVIPFSPLSTMSWTSAEFCRFRL